MAYVAGDTILDDEYNAFLTNTSGTIGINHTMGTGATVYGLGQTELPAVQGGTDSGTTVTAASWNAFSNAIRGLKSSGATSSSFAPNRSICSELKNNCKNEPDTR